MIRTGKIAALLATNAVSVTCFDNGRNSITPVSRPFLGGAAAGFHYGPDAAGGDEVAVHHDHTNMPIGAMSIMRTPKVLTPLKPGEVKMMHRDGRIGPFLAADGTSTLLKAHNSTIGAVGADGTSTLLQFANVIVGRVVPSGATTIYSGPDGSISSDGTKLTVTSPTTFTQPVLLNGQTAAGSPGNGPVTYFGQATAPLPSGYYTLTIDGVARRIAVY